MMWLRVPHPDVVPPGGFDAVIVDLPDPDNPVNHTTLGVWPFCAARASGVTSTACQWTLVARLSPCSIIPAATVASVSLSIRMKPPSALSRS